MHRSPFWLIPLFLIFTGCQEALVPYLLNQGLQHGNVLLRAAPVNEVLKNPRLDARTVELLTLSQWVLEFAKKDLGMKTKKHYQRFVPLNKDWLIQAVSAAHKDRLEAHHYSYPLFGKLPYKGFYSETDAVKEENRLKSLGFDTYRRKVSAFSTTGWFSDPIVSSMFHTKSYFINILIHELVHAQFYFKNQAPFNEAFATWFANEATLRFIDKYKSKIKDYKKLRSSIKKNHAFNMENVNLVKAIKERAELFYKGKSKKNRKPLFDWIVSKINSSEKYSKMKDSKKINNAWILSLSTYYDLVPVIDNYAKKNHLTEAAFLKKIVLKGKGILKQIGI